MYTNQIPVFSIDLNDEEYERWDEVIAADKKVVKRLAKEADEDYEAYPGFVKTVLGRYMDEIQAWADALGRSVGDVTLMNCAHQPALCDGKDLRESRGFRGCPVVLSTCSVEERGLSGCERADCRCRWPSLPRAGVNACRCFRFSGLHTRGGDQGLCLFALSACQIRMR